MVYFKCPHCEQEYDDISLLEQERVMIENPCPLGLELFTLVCPNCLDDFQVIRKTTIEFQVRDK